MKKTITYLMLICLCIAVFFFAKNNAAFSLFGAEKSTDTLNAVATGNVNASAEIAVNQGDAEAVIAVESMTLRKGDAGIKFGDLEKNNFISTFGQPDSIDTSFAEVYNDTVVTYDYNDCNFTFLDNDLVSLHFKDDTFRFNLGIKGIDFSAGGPAGGLYKHFAAARKKEGGDFFRMFISGKGISSDDYIVFSLHDGQPDHDQVIEYIVFQ